MNIVDLKSINGLTKISFVLENCDCIEFPVECIVSGDVDYTRGNEDSGYLSIHIKDNGKGENFGGYNTDSPCQRLSRHNDIVCMELNFEDDSTERLVFPWANENYDNNEYEVTNLKSHNEIEVSIDLRNYTLSLNEVLRCSEGSVFERKSSNDRVIIVIYENDKYLVEEFTGELISVSASLMDEEFILVEEGYDEYDEIF